MALDGLVLQFAIYVDGEIDLGRVSSDETGSEFDVQRLGDGASRPSIERAAERRSANWSLFVPRVEASPRVKHSSEVSIPSPTNDQRQPEGARQTRLAGATSEPPQL